MHAAGQWLLVVAAFTAVGEEQLEVVAAADAPLMVAIGHEAGASCWAATVQGEKRSTCCWLRGETMTAACWCLRRRQLLAGGEEMRRQLVGEGGGSARGEERKKEVNEKGK